MEELFHKALTQSKDTEKLKDITPFDSKDIIVRDELSTETFDRYYKLGFFLYVYLQIFLGLQAISLGKLAVVVLAGGQASRLGSTSPKGTIKLGANIGELDSLFFIQALQIMRLKQLAKEINSTVDATREHFNSIKKITHLDDSDVIIFTQNEIPCFDNDGKHFMKDKDTIVTAPDGNGGFYKALTPLLPDLEKRGVEYFHVYCVDNVLCKVGDPVFVGSAIERKVDVVEKKHSEEAVGHVCKHKNLVRIVEYSEITKELAEERDETGKLKFRHGSIANHFFTLTFLKSVCTPTFQLPYHIARKKIPHLNLETGEYVVPSQPNGIKLEQFIFDTFYLSRNFLLYQVNPNDEFSPLKNADSAGVDCPSTCVRDLNNARLSQPEVEWIFTQCAQLT